VALAAIFLGVVVLVSLAVLAITGLRLWRETRAAQKRIEPEQEALTAKLDRLSAALEARPERQAELQGEITDLQARIKALTVLARSAGEAQKVLRRPLRYFTG
jgi:hypothetical protein